jgi:hypothetical protein
MMMAKKLTVILAGILMLATAGVAKASTPISTTSATNAAIILAQAGDEGIDAGDMVTIENGDPDFEDGFAYEVMADQTGDLFVEDDDGDTWNLVSASEDGDSIELEYDGRIVSGDDVDS